MMTLFSDANMCQQSTIESISITMKIQNISDISKYTFTLGLSGRRGIFVACVCPCVRLSVCLFVCLSVRKRYLVRTITRHRFELESPNLHQAWIMGCYQLVLKMEVIDNYLQCHFGHFDPKFLGNSACPHDNLGTHLGQNHLICTKHASWDTLSWYWKYR